MPRDRIRNHNPIVTESTQGDNPVDSDVGSSTEEDELLVYGSDFEYSPFPNPQKSCQLVKFPLLKNYVPSPLSHEVALELNATTKSGCHSDGLLSPTRLVALRETQSIHPIHVTTFFRRPDAAVRCLDSMQSRAYVGQFTPDGSHFLGAFQNSKRIRLYDCYNDFKIQKDIYCRNLRWTVTDTALSKDQRFLLYSTVSQVVHLVNTGSSGSVSSVANVTDIHEPLHFMIQGEYQASGIWSIKWSWDDGEIIAGAADAAFYVYDVVRGSTVQRVQGHADDVNAVCYLDEHLIVTGSDDSLIRVWDRRLLSSQTGHVGVFLGHLEGVTHMDPKKDGRYLISTSKDQSIKLWDMRKSLISASQADVYKRSNPVSFDWDYRWMHWPAAGHVIDHPNDGSIATYRGLEVISTLIRSYFSPQMTTGQRYIYAGSGDGKVRMWDIVTNKVVQTLEYHKEVVRDCSWHPHECMMATSSFDGSIILWEPTIPGDADSRADEAHFRAEQREPGTGEAAARKAMRVFLPRPGNDRLSDFF